MKLIILLFILSFNLNASINATEVNAFNGDLNIKAQVFMPETNPEAILILTPTIAGLSFIEKSLARYFSKNRFMVIVPLPYLSEVDKERPTVENLDREFLLPANNAQIFLKNLNQNALQLPVFALGASQGGFRTLIITSQLTEVKASWIVTAGADFASIYANSKVKKIVDFKNKLKNVYQLSTDQAVEDFLRTELKNDPMNLCKQFDKPFVQVIALKDVKVPTENQLKLRDACPSHEVIYLNAGHVSASLSMLKDRKKILNYFRQFIE